MIAILDYSAGNIRSVQNALDSLGVEHILSHDQEQIDRCDKLIIPGVGEAGKAMSFIREKHLDELICNFQKPVLGICLGMQILCNHSEESDSLCLGVFDCAVRKFDDALKVPHMGWNNLRANKSRLIKKKHQDIDYYFVHSYYAEICSDTSSLCDYGISFSASIERDNYFGVQFHPEKSSESGRDILKNFIEL